MPEPDGAEVTTGWSGTRRLVFVGLAVGLLVPLAVVAFGARTDTASNPPLRAERLRVASVCDDVSAADLYLDHRTRPDGVERLVFREAGGRRRSLPYTEPWTISCEVRSR